jgi:hypothetical protein
LLLRQLVPYPDTPENLHVAKGVVDGRLDLRTSLPTVGSPVCLTLATLARRCLNPTPQRRPTAVELVAALTGGVGAAAAAAAPSAAGPMVRDVFFLFYCNKCVITKNENIGWLDLNILNASFS